MKMLFLLAGNRLKASSRVRAYWIAEDLQKLGYSTRLIPPSGRLGMLKTFFTVPSHDVIVFQKTYSKVHLWLMRWAKMLNKTTVLDIDDAPSMTQNPTTLKHFGQLAKLADYVFAGSNNLVDFAKQQGGHAVLIPSSLSIDAYYTNPAAEKKYDLVWVGNAKFYGDDLIDILYPALELLCQRQHCSLLLIGVENDHPLISKFREIEGLSLSHIAQLNWADSSELAHQLSQCRVGLYPLKDNDFNAFKCGFKALEYMALNLPVISSDVALNKDIVLDHKTGFIARNTEDWVDRLERLLQDSSLQHHMGQAGHQHLLTHYSSTVVAQKIHDYLSN